MPRIQYDLDEWLQLPRAIRADDNAYVPVLRIDTYTPAPSWRDSITSLINSWVQGPHLPPPRPISRLCNRVFDSHIRRDSPADILLHAIYAGIVIGAVVHGFGAAVQASELTMTIASWTIAFIYNVVAQDGTLHHLQY